MQFANAVLQAKWGTVIEVDPDASINLKDENRSLTVAEGVTIRGGRHGVRPGAEISSPFTSGHGTSPTLVITGSDVRITGLRLHGPSRGRDHGLPEAAGIKTDSAFNTIIDHNDMSEWTHTAVIVDGGNASCECTALFPPSRPETVRVVRNYLHHNEMWGLGYGVVVGDNGYASIVGNTFLANRHAIAMMGLRSAAIALGSTLYSSMCRPIRRPNRVPRRTVRNRILICTEGTPSVSRKKAGLAAPILKLQGTPFTGGSNRHILELRGTPCYLAEFHNNLTLESLSRSIKNEGDSSKLVYIDTNRFEAPNPTDRLGVGDFDGDGLDDLFLATGKAWYYAPAGKAEWRFLNVKNEGIDDLLFGDFDGDGRTDVLTQHGNNLEVSWGGASQWEKINERPAPMKDFAIGDFIGDRRADIFYADGSQWYISDGGVGAFTPVDTSSYRIADLRFGDFDADGKMDVFSVEGGQWKVAYSGTSGWQPLRGKLTDSVANLIVADFNGDGRADVATVDQLIHPTRFNWKVSYSGTGGWTALRTFSEEEGRRVAARGRFDGDAGVDMLLWHVDDSYLDIAAQGTGILVRHSLQDMR